MEVVAVGTALIGSLATLQTDASNESRIQSAGAIVLQPDGDTGSVGFTLTDDGVGLNELRMSTALTVRAQGLIQFLPQQATAAGGSTPFAALNIIAADGTLQVIDVPPGYMPAGSAEGGIELGHAGALDDFFLYAGHYAFLEGDSKVLLITNGGSTRLDLSASSSLFTVTAAGAGSNIGINLVSKGSGTVQINGSPVMSNPMTSVGDIVYGGVAGAPTRLASGANTYVLTSNGLLSAPSWQAAAAGVSWPLTNAGDEAFQPDAVANNALNLQNAALAVNGVNLQGTASATWPIFSAVGGDINIGITLTPKGSGNVSVSANALYVPPGTTGGVDVRTPGGTLYLGETNATGGVFTPQAFSAGGLTTSTNSISSPGSMVFLPNGTSTTLLSLISAATVVNGFSIQGAATTVSPSFVAQGSDTNIGIKLTPKGSGAVTITAGNLALTAGSVLVAAGQGIDTSGAGALEIGAATATSVVITPATSIAGGLSSTRITKRVLAAAGPGATPAIDTDTYDVAHFTALAAAITSMTTDLTGTPVDGDTLRISFTDNGTARAITWGTGFEASTVVLPTTTVISARLDVGFVWNTETSKWRCVASA